MPYSIYKKNGKFCVKNSDTGESKGCSVNRAMAVKHMKAMYAAESSDTKELEGLVTKALKEYETEYKETIPAEELLDTKGYAPYGVCTFADLETYRDAQETAMELWDKTSDFIALTENIMYNSEITDKVAAIKRLSDEYSQVIAEADTQTETKDSNKKDNAKDYYIKTAIAEYEPSLIEKLFAKVKEWLSPPPIDTLMVWKEADSEQYHWLARYSNNILDDDFPHPEIISERSHRTFIDRVEKGKSPYPELWLYHVPEWRLGKATWLAYDDTSGFALAAGTINKGKAYEDVAEWLGTQNMLTSHGMPKPLIKYDPADPRVIIEHETREISPLPPHRAANKRTGFGVYLNKEADNMAIPANKKEELKKMGLTDEQLTALEQANAAQAEQAKQQGVETKELPPAQVPTPETVPATKDAEPQVDVPVEQPVNPITREEIAEAVAGQFNPLVERLAALETVLSDLSKQIKQLKESDEAKIAEKAKETPVASLAAMLTQRIIGNPATQVKSNDPLATATPTITPPQKVSTVTGIPFIDNMLTIPAGK